MPATVAYLAIALTAFLVVFWLRGPRYAAGALLVLGALYTGFVVLATWSM